jgi:WD40 repeat protein
MVYVWPLDFQEYFFEATFESTLGAVELSPDGLSVTCGTQFGSISILDLSNQDYKTLMRAHSDDIIAMDFHLQTQQVITASKDKTLRLFDIETCQENFEFSCPVDQVLSISAHPTLPIFSCGFESGKMRVFNIDTLQVADEFS